MYLRMYRYFIIILFLAGHSTLWGQQVSTSAEAHLPENTTGFAKLSPLFFTGATGEKEHILVVGTDISALRERLREIGLSSRIPFIFPLPPLDHDLVCHLFADRDSGIFDAYDQISI